MKVRQVPPGQSPLVMQPLPLLTPPEQAPVSQELDGQSESWQQTAPLLAHRPVSFVQRPQPGQALVPVLHTPPQGAPGVEPPTQRFASPSPVK